jgi:dolichol-phosphate mannosyltransferase
MSHFSLRGLLVRPEDLSGPKGVAEAGSSARIDLIALLSPCGDLIAYFAAVGFGASVERGQIAGFTLAAAMSLASLLRAHLHRALRWTLGRYLVLITIALLALFLRSGVLGLLTNVFNWPAGAAIVFAVITTAAVIRSGIVYCARGASLRLGGGKDWRTGALGLLLCAWLLRLIYCAQIELLPTETYYWNYSRHLDFGYLDHPPMVALLIRTGTAVFGNTEFGVRISALCLSLVTAFFVYRLTRNVFGEPSAWLAALLTQTLPFFFFTSGMTMTPDAPLTAAWAASLYYLERALIAKHARAWWGAGLCFGLGMLSKYTIGLLGVAVCIFMVLDGQSRKWWRRPEPYAAAFIALAVFSPVIMWNAEHEWASFAFQSTRRLAEKHQFALHLFIASALVLVTPTGIAAAAALLRRRAPFCATDDATARLRAWRFLQTCVGVPLAAFAAFSLFHEMNLDWPGPAWIAAVPVMAFGMVQVGDSGAGRLPALVRAAWLPTLLALLLFDGLRFQYFTVGIPGLGYGQVPESVPVGWRELGRQIHDIKEHAGGDPLIVGMDQYFLASELAFYAPNPRKAVLGTTNPSLFGRSGLMYERWLPPSAERGRTLLLVAWNAADLDAPDVQAAVESLAPVQTGELRRNGNFIRPYFYRFAYGYRAYSPEQQGGASGATPAAIPPLQRELRISWSSGLDQGECR